MDDKITESKNAKNIKDKSEELQSKGFTQLEEKMEQVKNQVAIIERKYDELYKSIKAKEQPEKVAIGSAEQISPIEIRRENVAREKLQRDKATKENSWEPHPLTSHSTAEDKKEMLTKSATNVEKKESNKNTTKTNMDLEKMEDNPFM